MSLLLVAGGIGNTPQHLQDRIKAEASEQAMSGGGSAVILGVPQRAPGLGQAWAAVVGMLGSTAGALVAA